MGTCCCAAVRRSAANALTQAAGQGCRQCLIGSTAVQCCGSTAVRQRRSTCGYRDCNVSHLRHVQPHSSINTKAVKVIHSLALIASALLAHISLCPVSRMQSDVIGVTRY
jgi:hypothetical protein